VYEVREAMNDSLNGEKPIMQRIRVDMEKMRIVVDLSGEDITAGTMAVIDQTMVSRPIPKYQTNI